MKNNAPRKTTAIPLSPAIDETVDQKLEERLGDPDVGLEINAGLIERTRTNRRSKVAASAEDVAQRLELKR